MYDFWANWDLNIESKWRSETSDCRYHRISNVIHWQLAVLELDLRAAKYSSRRTEVVSMEAQFYSPGRDLVHYVLFVCIWMAL